MERLCKIASPNQIPQSLQEFPHMNCCTVKVKEALGEDRDRDDATHQNWPHYQPALLDVINHAGFVVFFAGCGKRTTRCRCDWSLNATVSIWLFRKCVLLSGAFLPSFRRRRPAELGSAVATHQFAGRIEHGITGLFARCIVTVNDLVQKRAVLGALGLFQKAAGIVILVTALETQAAI